MNGELEIVYPPVSIRSAPSVTWVDSNVAQHNSRLRPGLTWITCTPIKPRQSSPPMVTADQRENSEGAPEPTAGYRALPDHADRKDWNDAQIKFFGENGIFDDSYQPGVQTGSANTHAFKP